MTDSEKRLDAATKALLPAVQAFADAYRDLEALRNAMRDVAPAAVRPTMNAARGNFPARVATLLVNLGLGDVIGAAPVALFGTSDGIAKRFTAAEERINAQLRTTLSRSGSPPEAA